MRTFSTAYLHAIIFLLVFIGTCLHSTLFGQDVLMDTILKRRERATLIRPSQPNQALQLLETTLDLAKKENSKTGEMIMQEGLGYYYFLEYQLEAAINAYQLALKLSIELDSVRHQGYNLNHLANTYFRLDRLEKALEYANQAYEVTKQGKDSLTQGRILSLKEDINTQLGKEEEAIEIYLQGYTLFDKLKDEVNKNIITSNISYNYLVNGKGEQAIPYIQQAMDFNKKRKNQYGIAIGHGNLGYAYFLIKDFPKAYENYQVCVDIAKKNRLTKVEHDTYKDISDTFLADNNPRQALVYFKKYHQLRDSVIGAKTQNRIVELEVKFETTQKENTIQTLRQEKHIQRLQLFSLLGGIALLTLSAFLVISRMRNNIRKKQALIAKNEEIHQLEKELMKNQLQQKELEQQQIAEQLAYKTQHLTDFALDITKKNELSNELLEKIKNIEKEQIPKEVSNQLRHLGTYINSHLQINEGLTTFRQNVEELNLEFNRQLKQQFPELSAKDLILCGLLRLNLQNKEIATIRAVSDNAIKMARYRLRKKLGLGEAEDIVAFLRVVV